MFNYVIFQQEITSHFVTKNAFLILIYHSIHFLYVYSQLEL